MCGLFGWPPLPRTDLKKVQTFLFSLEAGGSNDGDLDECEDVIGGLSKAMDLEWQAKTRMLYLVCDNPPHGRRFSHPDAQKLLECLVLQRTFCVVRTVNSTIVTHPGFCVWNSFGLAEVSP